MADNLTILGKELIVAGSEHIRDSDYEESLCEGEMFVGDSLSKGTAETQVKAHTGGDVEFKGLCAGHLIRQSDTETLGSGDRTDAVTLGSATGGLLVPGKTVKFLKPTGGRVRVRFMAHGYTTGATIESGAPVYFKSTGSTIGSTLSGLGNLFIDPACTDDATIIGRTAKAIAAPDATTNDVNVEGEMWY